MDPGRESFGDESLRDIDRLRKDLKLAQQHLNMVYQNGESSPSRSSSPESNGTAVEQNRLNFAQEKQGSTCEKGKTKKCLCMYFFIYIYQGRSHRCARVCRCHPQWQLAHLKTDAELLFV